MEQLNHHRWKHQVLRAVYKIAPFDLKGDWPQPAREFKRGFVSCLIIASRPKEIGTLLEELSFQTLAKEKLEVVVLNDGAGPAVRQLVEKHRGQLNIIYHENPTPQRVLSNLRNATLALAQGEYVLFLDDDTRILQNDFLAVLMGFFEDQPADILMPLAKPLYGILKVKYDFLDEFSVTNRCCAYRRDVLEQLGGFKKGLNTYEDIELSIRAAIKGCAVFKTDKLEYFHPPLYFDSMRKPLSIGQTIFQIKRHYSFLVWLLVYLNALRFLPYGLIPQKICQQWFKISCGVLAFPFMRRSYYY